MTATDAGIDYSLGKSNIDCATGIRYGVISQHSLCCEALGELEPVYSGPNCPKCGGDAIESECFTPAMQEWEPEFGCADYACEDCEIVFDSDRAYSEQAIGLEYEDSEYSLTDCLDADVMILKSPYYTHAQFCSPCVPGAGNLDNPCTEGPRTYALGHEWFEGNTASYPVYRVADDTLVIPGQLELSLVV